MIFIIKGFRIIVFIFIISTTFRPIYHTYEKPHNKLFQIQPILKERNLDPNNTRREETTLTRLRIGHTRLTHSFIHKEEPPQNVHVETYTQSSTFW